MMKKQRLFPLLLAILLFVPLLGGASASEASESETSAPVGEAFSTTEYVLNRDDDYYHFSSITDVQIRGYIGGDLDGFFLRAEGQRDHRRQPSLCRDGAGGHRRRGAEHHRRVRRGDAGGKLEERVFHWGFALLFRQHRRPDRRGAGGLAQRTRGRRRERAGRPCDLP